MLSFFISNFYFPFVLSLYSLRIVTGTQHRTKKYIREKKSTLRQINKFISQQQRREKEREKNRSF